MRFGPVPIVELEGAILAHSLTLPGGVLKKGRVLTPDDVRHLRQAGYREVAAARLDPEDLHEDRAAALVAEALVSEHTRVGRAFTGRCNLLASRDGVVAVDASGLNALNRVHESITVAALPDGTPVEAGTLVATVKIIPLAAPRAAVERVRSVTKGPPAVDLAPFRPARAGLILTTLPGTRERVLERARENLETRLVRMGSELVAARRCHHDEEGVAAALSELLARNLDPVLILGASQVADRRDVVPAAIERIGGMVERVGIPVDPGNLLLWAHRNGTRIIGVPGCARSLRRSGFDRVLERTLAGLEVHDEFLTALGAGGLLKEVTRPQPRRGPQHVQGGPIHIAGLVLAGGSSARMGDVNKLVEELEGKPMVAHVVDALRDAGVHSVTVVTGHDAPALRSALDGRPVRFVHNADYESGLSSSLRVGVGNLPEDADAALICLADMPWVAPRLLERLIDAFDPQDGRSICVPVYKRKRGNPVLWASAYFSRMLELGGDHGAKSLMAEFPEEVCEVTAADASVLVDLDTPEALRGARTHGLDGAPPA